jgi:hypothetical protein
MIVEHTGNGFSKKHNLSQTVPPQSADSFLGYVLGIFVGYDNHVLK